MRRLVISVNWSYEV